MKKCIILSLLLLSFACKHNTEIQIPADVLPQDKMALVIADMEVLESSLALGVVKRDHLPSADSLAMYDVFKKNQINKEQYDNSLKFYSAHPELLNIIYDEALKELKKKETEDAK